jgi:hypothetical protein
MKFKKIFSLLLFLSVATTCFSQSAGRISISREIDFSKGGFTHNISGNDTLRADTLTIPIYDNYILTGIAMSGTPVLNIYAFVGMHGIKVNIDSLNPNLLSQYNLYDTSSFSNILKLSSWFNCGNDSLRYKKVYTYYKLNDLLNYDYIFLSLVNVHTFYPTVNKIHIIFYFRRFI